MYNYNPGPSVMAPEDIHIRIAGNAAADLRHLAERLGIAPEDVVTDALRLLRTTVTNGLYVRKGRLTPQAPALHALGFWREIIDSGATGRIEVGTSRGPVAFRLPAEAFHKSPFEGMYAPPMWEAQGTSTMDYRA